MQNDKPLCVCLSMPYPLTGTQGMSVNKKAGENAGKSTWVLQVDA
jgi:hypothetical protein